jgi:hypothetical protein
MKQYEINNQSGSVLVSDLLEQVLLSTKEHYNIEAENVTVEELQNVKDVGEIILTVSLTLASGVLLELFKFWLNRFKNRPDYDKKMVIVINEQQYTLEELAVTESEL